MESKLIVSSSPHLHSGQSTQKIMLKVIIALIPSVVASVVIFGPKALLITAVSVCSAVAAEFVCRKVMKRSQTVGDLSAVVTGILLALNLPVGINPIMAAFGAAVAIIVVKQMFGGIGQNFVNPALAARIILLVSFPQAMTTWSAPFSYLNKTDAVTCATPLAQNAADGFSGSYIDLFLGNTGGCLGETCALAIIIGGVYLICSRVISPTIPLVYLGSVALLALLMGQDPLFHILSGGVMLGAFFMATDYTTSPVTAWGKVIFAIGCAIFTMLIRVYANLPEGVSFSILIMNILVPHIENLTRPKAFGFVKEKKSRKAAEK